MTEKQKNMVLQDKNSLEHDDIIFVGMGNYCPKGTYKNNVHNLGERFCDEAISFFESVSDGINTVKLPEINCNEYFKKTFLVYGTKISFIFIKGYINQTGYNMSYSKVIKGNEAIVFVYDDITIKSGNYVFKPLKFNTRHNGVLGIMSYMAEHEKSNVYAIRIGATKPQNMLCNNFVLSDIDSPEINLCISELVVKIYKCFVQQKDISTIFVRSAKELEKIKQENNE